MGELSERPLFNLKWCKYTSNLCEAIATEEDLDKSADVTLICGSVMVKAHRIILAASSDFFKVLLADHSSEDTSISLVDIGIQELTNVLKFIYHGEVKLKENEVETFLEAAYTLCIKGLPQVGVQDNPGKKGLNHGEVPRCVPQQSENSSKPQERHLMRTNDTKKLTQIADKVSFAEQLPVVKNTQDIGNVSSKQMKVESTETDALLEVVSDDSDVLEPLDPFKIKPPEIMMIEDLDQWNPKDCETQRLPNPTLPTSEPSFPVPFSQESQLCDRDPGGLAHVEVILRDERIPRPPNAFMIFANEWRRKVAQNYPGENNKEISVRLGQMWKSLTKNEKDPYYQASHIADRNHREKYPNYYYSPKEARIRKTLRQQKRNLDPISVLKLAHVGAVD